MLTIIKVVRHGQKKKKKKDFVELMYAVCLAGFFWAHHAACGMLVACPGIDPCPLQWKCGVLTTGPPGNSLYAVKKGCSDQKRAWGDF